MARVSGPPGGRPSPVLLADRAAGAVPVADGPIERLMAATIRRLAWSRLANPKVAVAVSGVGLLLGMVVGATAPNAETLPLKLPLTYLLPSLSHYDVLAAGMLYTGDVLACLGLAGMLWAHSQGWRPNPRHLLLISSAIVAVMVSLTPVGSSDTASYAAYGRIAATGGNPYTTSPLASGHPVYANIVASQWRNQPSVYGPFATLIQSFAASVGGPHVAITVWVLMIMNGLAFIGVGVLLLKTSHDPLRATLFWTANPVLIQQLVSGGHLDTFVAAAGIFAIQVARHVSGRWGDVVTGLLIGVACDIKMNAVLIGAGLAWPLLLRREWMRTARIAAVALATLVVPYSFWGLAAFKPLLGGLGFVTLPSPWLPVQWAFHAVGLQSVGITIMTFSWPILMLVVAWLVYQRISSDQPPEIVAPFALTYAWILVFPWVFAWYTAITWATLTQVPRNRMTRWLTLVTVFLALCHSSG